MVVRLSHISSKTGKKSFLCVFLASRPYRLSHINALCINQSYQRPIHEFVFKKYWELGELKNSIFFLLPHENQLKFLEEQGWAEIIFTNLLYNSVNICNPVHVLEIITCLWEHKHCIGDFMKCFAPLWISCFNQYARYFTHNGVTRILAKDFDRPEGIFQNKWGGGTSLFGGRNLSTLIDVGLIYLSKHRELNRWSQRWM